jgi:hypothetical protein
LAGFEVTLIGRFWVTPEAALRLSRITIEAQGNISKVDVHTLLYPGTTTKVYAHLLLWFGGSKHTNIGYSSTDMAQIKSQIDDMVSRGIDGVIIDWYGPNNSIDQATQLGMTQAENHPGFTFAIMIDQGAIEWVLAPWLFAATSTGERTAKYRAYLLPFSGLHDDTGASSGHKF